MIALPQLIILNYLNDHNKHTPITRDWINSKRLMEQSGSNSSIRFENLFLKNVIITAILSLDEKALISQFTIITFFKKIPNRIT